MSAPSITAPAGTNAAWAIKVLQLGHWPVTRNNVVSIMQWMASEEPPSNWSNRNNPLNNGLGSGGGSGLGSYANLGLAAHYVVANLKTGNFGYAAIDHALARSAPPSVTAAAIQHSSWASSHYGYGSNWYQGPVPIYNTGGRRLGTTATLTAATPAAPHRHPKTEAAGGHAGNGQRVEVLQSELTAFTHLVGDGNSEAGRAASRARQVQDAVHAATADPLVGSEAAALVPLAEELTGILSQMSTVLERMKTLLHTTSTAVRHADTGTVGDPGLAALLSQLRSMGVPASVLAGIKRAATHSSTSGPPASSSSHPARPPARPPQPAQLAASSPTAAKEEAKVVAAAKAYLGVPYAYGGDSHAGIDCSGLTSSAYHNALGIDIGRDTSAQLASGRVVGHDGDWALDRRLLQPGDLIFYGQPGASGPNAHVVMYIGDGKVIEAPHTGEDVKIIPLFSSAAPDEPFLGVRRYIREGAAVA